jgi:hypothetical protein
MSEPIHRSYWVQPGKLLAGAYPSAWTEEELQAKLRFLLESGATFFLDLSEQGEKGLPPYKAMLQEEAEALGITVEYRRMPIHDFETPTVAEMKQILETIDAALARGQVIYTHCYFGLGRTGTVAGCYLVEQGFNGEQALDELVRVRRGTPLEQGLAPSTPEQRQMVRDWSKLKSQI